MLAFLRYCALPDKMFEHNVFAHVHWTGQSLP